jgi:hypothetical protein
MFVFMFNPGPNAPFEAPEDELAAAMSAKGFPPSWRRSSAALEPLTKDGTIGSKSVNGKCIRAARFHRTTLTVLAACGAGASSKFRMSFPAEGGAAFAKLTDGESPGEAKKGFVCFASCFSFGKREEYIKKTHISWTNSITILYYEYEDSQFTISWQI